MSRKVKDIVAYGTSGSVMGKEFNALYRNGFYELHSEELAKNDRKTTQLQRNQSFRTDVRRGC